jgi:hypothetical protein
MRGELRAMGTCERHRYGLLLLVASACLAAVGCSGAQPPLTPAGGSIEATKANSVEATELATVEEARSLLANFSQPEEKGDLGYEALGADHNDIAGWTRAVVLAHADYGRLVHSLARYQSDVATAALADFDSKLASKGATATYDAVLGAEWRLQEKVTLDDVRLGRLVPASTFMGRLFDRNGRLDESYSLKAVTVRGDVATATYAKDGSPDVTIEFELARDVNGGLRVAGVRNYEEFRRAIVDSELVEGLP